MSFNENEDTYEPEHVGSIKCALDGKVYHYILYKEKDGTSSSSIDKYDKIPSNVINYNSVEEWHNSIETYYKNKGGMCP